VEKKVPIGTPVHYYPEGVSFNKHPVAATVLDYNGNGICTLLGHTESIRSSVKVNVWHIDSPELVEKEHLRPLYGAWDYHPWFLPPVNDPQPVMPSTEHKPTKAGQAKRELIGTDS